MRVYELLEILERLPQDEELHCESETTCYDIGAGFPTETSVGHWALPISEAS
jgi:hypothetical protein